MRMTLKRGLEVTLRSLESETISVVEHANQKQDHFLLDINVAIYLTSHLTCFDPSLPSPRCFWTDHGVCESVPAAKITFAVAGRTGAHPVIS